MSDLVVRDEGLVFEFLCKVQVTVNGYLNAKNG